MSQNDKTVIFGNYDTVWEAGIQGFAGSLFSQG